MAKAEFTRNEGNIKKSRYDAYFYMNKPNNRVVRTNQLPQLLNSAKK